MIDYSLRDAFGGFILIVLEYCSAVWCSTADTHLTLLGSVVGGLMWSVVAPLLTSPVYPSPSFFLWLVLWGWGLSGRTGSELTWHTHGRVLKLRELQQVLRFVARIYTVQYLELKGYCP